MSKMKELSMVLDELVTCGETLISTANALREIFSEPAADTGPTTTTAKSTKTAKAQAAKPAKATQNQSETSEAAEPSPDNKPDQSPTEAAPAPKSYTKEEVRGILARISCAGHSDEVRALLAKYGAKQLKQVDPKDYAALIKEAASIGQIKTEEDEVNTDE